jgi:U3 small nucleolar RNA-associated protein 4
MYPRVILPLTICNGLQVNLSTAVLNSLIDSYGGACWSITSSPRSPSLLVGVEDGARLFSYEGRSQLRYVRSLPSTGCRVLSVAFHPTAPRLYLGCADGTIRCLDEASLAALHRFTGDVKRGLCPHIFSILVLADSTVTEIHTTAPLVRTSRY